MGFRYILCVDQCNLLTVNVYVSFRSKHPDETTIKDVLKELQDNNIEVNKLAIWGRDHCEQE